MSVSSALKPQVCPYAGALALNKQSGVFMFFVCTWAQDERPADLHMAQPNVPVIKTGHIPPARPGMFFVRRPFMVQGVPLASSLHVASLSFKHALFDTGPGSPRVLHRQSLKFRCRCKTPPGSQLLASLA
jgi:hypothetical protein